MKKPKHEWAHMINYRTDSGKAKTKVMYDDLSSARVLAGLLNGHVFTCRPRGYAAYYQKLAQNRERSRKNRQELLHYRKMYPYVKVCGILMFIFALWGWLI